MPTIDELRRLLAADPDDPFVLYGLAQQHAKAGDHAEAVAFYDRCLASDPAYLYAYFHKAKSLDEIGRREEAADTLREGLDRARAAGDEKAAAEITVLLEEYAS